MSLQNGVGRLRIFLIGTCSVANIPSHFLILGCFLSHTWLSSETASRVPDPLNSCIRPRLTTHTPIISDLWRPDTQQAGMWIPCSKTNTASARPGPTGSGSRSQPLVQMTGGVAVSSRGPGRGGNGEAGRGGVSWQHIAVSGCLAVRGVE